MFLMVLSLSQDSYCITSLDNVEIYVSKSLRLTQKQVDKQLRV